MAEHLAEFLAGRMRIDLAIEPLPRDRLMQSRDGSVVLSDSGGGDVEVEESFTLTVEQQRIVVLGRDVAGLRDGVVKLVDLMGARQGPILPRGERVYPPRVAVRLGVVPWLGSYPELVFMGHNAVLVNTYYEGEESLFALSTSNAIPELNMLRRPEVLARLIRTAPRGTALWCAGLLPAEYKTEVSAGRPCPRRTSGNPWGADLERGRRIHSVHRTPLVQRYLKETVEELFRAAALDGVLLINGGESFYHCFMRSYGTAKGHTNCRRCEPLGAETVVANLSNNLVAAARRVNPSAEVIAWPYSAEHVWSADRYQIGVIDKLQPGAGILTEVEKDETVAKPEGIVKYIADYSIDLIGPGARARRQVEACKAAGVPIHIKSEPELGFEAPAFRSSLAWTAGPHAPRPW